MENFELNVNLTECSFSIKGTEEFIDRKTKEILELLTNYKRDIPKTVVQTKDMFTSNECNKVDTNLSYVNHYKKYEDAGIVSIDEDKVLILRQIPGKNNAAKMKNIALITLYVLDKSIESKSIVENCEKMSCYDSKNFSAIFKNDKSGNFIRKGKGQNWTLTLTIPGKEAAVALLEDMYNAIKK